MGCWPADSRSNSKVEQKRSGIEFGLTVVSRMGQESLAALAVTGDLAPANGCQLLLGLRWTAMSDTVALTACCSTESWSERLTELENYLPPTPRYFMYTSTRCTSQAVELSNPYLNSFTAPPPA